MVGVTALAAAAAAWIYLQLPIPASIQYVQDKLNDAVRVHTTRVDQIEVLGLQNRLETLKQNRQGIEREKFDLTFKQQQVRDPGVRDIISQRLRSIDEDSRNIEQTTSETAAELKKLRK